MSRDTKAFCCASSTRHSMRFPVCKRCIHSLNMLGEPMKCLCNEAYEDGEVFLVEDVVTGKIEFLGRKTCEQMRSLSGVCGVDGLFFEERDMKR